MSRVLIGASSAQSKASVSTLNLFAHSSAGLRYLLLAGGLALLHGCSGDARPLTEAVEVEEQGIESLQIRPPARSIEDPEFSVSLGQQVQFTLIANGGDGNLEVDATDRRWRVSDSSIASINDDGLLMGLTADPVPVEVSVAIGGIVAESYQVRVSDASLTRFDELVGGVQLEPCLPENYVIAGSFEDGTRRLVPDVRWALGEEIDAELATEDDGSASVSAQASGALTLRASAGEVEPFVATLNVAPALSSIAIEPATDPLAVNVDATLDLVARGQYARNAGDTGTPEESATQEETTAPEATTTPEDVTTTAVDITDNVNWSITVGEQYASVGNDLPDDKGRLRGRAAGSATVQVACGIVAEDTRQVTVSESSSGSVDEEGVVFEQGNSFILGIGAQETLRVSTGPTFDAANEITDVSYSLADTNGFVTLSTGTANDGFGTITGGAGTTTGTTTSGTTTIIGGTLGTGTGTLFSDDGDDDGSPTNNVVTGVAAGTATVNAIIDGAIRATVTITVQ